MGDENSGAKLVPSKFVIVISFILFWPLGFFFLYKRLTFDKTAVLNNIRILRNYGIATVVFGVFWLSLAPSAKYENGESGTLPHMVLALSTITAGAVMIVQARKAKLNYLTLLKAVSDEETPPTEAPFTENFSEILLKIKNPNVYSVVEKIDVTCKNIYEYVRAHPDKKSEIRQFEQYYIPKTIDLLQNYIRLDNGETTAGDIIETKIKLENFLADVQTAFLNELNSLYEDDAQNISMDIDIFKSFLEQDRLIDSDTSLTIEKPR